MVCKNCGKELAENAAFCGECGTRVETPQPPVTPPVVTEPAENNNGANSNNNKNDFFGKEPQTPPVEIDTPPYECETPPRDVVQKKSTAQNPLLIPLIIAAGVILVLVALFVNNLTKTTHQVVDGGSRTSFSLEVDELSAVTEDDKFVIHGSVSTTDYDAKITINGDFVEEFDANVENESWSEEVDLKVGENTFIVTLTDEDGNERTKTVLVTYEPGILYERGTILVKYNESGVYIRPTPRISETFIILIDRDDFTSQFVCLGEESKDEEGYIWCKVETPNDGVGWVRSDLMRKLD